MAEIFVAKEEEENLITPLGVKSYPMQGKKHFILSITTWKRSGYSWNGKYQS